MLKLFLASSLILNSALIWSQTATPAPQKGPGPEVAPNEVVLTVHGACEAADGRITGSCNTTLSREQFEKLLASLNTNNQTVAPDARRKVAQSYAQLMALTKAAYAAGTDKTERFQIVMQLVRMRTLGDMYRVALEDEYRIPPQAEIEAYYNQNRPKFEEVTLSRVFIPAKNTAAASKDDYDKKAAAVAAEMHDRAAKGEDMEKLQKEAYTRLGLTVVPPSSAPTSRRRGVAPRAEEEELFSLSPGQVDKLRQEPTGYLIFRCESKQIAPLEQVKDEISRAIFRQKMEKAMKEVDESVKADLNGKYFGPPEPSQQGEKPKP